MICWPKTEESRKNNDYKCKVDKVEEHQKRMTYKEWDEMVNDNTLEMHVRASQGRPLQAQYNSDKGLYKT